MVAATDGCVELLREVGEEVEDGGGVGGDTHLEVREGEGFGGGEASDVGEAVAHAGVDAGHEFDVADAVFEADEVWTTVA